MGASIVCWTAQAWMCGWHHLAYRWMGGWMKQPEYQTLPACIGICFCWDGAWFCKLAVICDRLYPIQRVQRQQNWTPWPHNSPPLNNMREGRCRAPPKGAPAAPAAVTAATMPAAAATRMRGGSPAPAAAAAPLRRAACSAHSSLPLPAAAAPQLQRTGALAECRGNTLLLVLLRMPRC